MTNRTRLSIERLGDRIAPAAGSLDPTFASGGFLTQDLPGYYQTGAQHVLVQPDGKAVVTGVARDVNADFPTVYRYTLDGQLDTTFNADGAAVLAIPGGTGSLYSAALQPDGKIVAAGTAQFGGNYQVMVVRLNADGTPDSSFGVNGFAFADPSPVDDNGFAVALQPDGKIVVAGNSQVQAGSNTTRMLALRFTAAGALDPTFDGDGIARLAFGASDPLARVVRVQADGKIVLAGTSSTSGGNFGFALARLNANGTPDPTFDGDGLVQTSPAGMAFQDVRDAVLLPDGKILAVGTAAVGQAYRPTPVLLRYTAGGALDATFDGDGIVTTDLPFNGGAANAAAVQPNGKILVAGGVGVPGGSKSILARYTPGGQLDTAFGPADQTLIPGVVVTDVAPGDNDGYTAVAVAPDRKVVAAGVAGGGSVQRLSVARYDVNRPAPTAAADAYSVDENDVLTVGGPGVLANDTLPGGFPAAVLVTQYPTYGTLQLDQAGGFTYTPDANYHGPDSFSYVLDNDLPSAPAVVSLTVEPVGAPADATFGWAAGGGGADADAGRSVSTDAAGNVLVTGGFRGTAHFQTGAGTVSLTSAGGTDVFVAKYSAAGQLLWIRQFGGSGDDEGRGVSADAAGNVYTTGYFAGTADFDPGAAAFDLTSAGDADLFVSKLDAAGNFVWARQLAPKVNGYDYGYGVKADAAGNVYTVGVFSGTQDFDPGTGTYNLTSAGAEDVFVSKLDAAGNFVWVGHFGGGAADYGNAVTVDSAGNVYFTGFAQGITADFDPGPGVSYLPGPNAPKVFVAKLDAAGGLVWAKAFTGQSYQVGLGVAVDAAGNVYTTGLFNGEVDFDPGPGTFALTSNGYVPPGSVWDAYVSKLDANGDFVWANQLGGASFDIGYGIAVDAAGNSYSTGYVLGPSTDFDPGPGVVNLGFAPGYSATFVRKLTPSGELAWAKLLGENNSSVGYAVAVDGAGNVYTTGAYYGGTSDFDPGPGVANLTGAGSTDFFLVKLTPTPERAPNHSFAWAAQPVGPVAANGKGDAVAADADGNVYVAGYFSGGVLAKYAPDGTMLWTRRYAELCSEARAVAVDAAGNVYVAGYLGNAASVGKIDASGNLVWAKHFYGDSPGGANGVSVDADGNVYTAGYFWGTADFDPGLGSFSVTSAGGQDGFVSKLDAAGNFVWVRQIAGGGSASLSGVAIDADGNVLATGGFQGTATVDPDGGGPVLTSAGGFDSFVTKIDPTGGAIWARSFGGRNREAGYGVAVDTQGNVYTTGYFSDTADFDPGPGVFSLHCVGVDDAYVSKLDAAGNFIWAKQLGGPAEDVGRAVAVDAAGNVYTTGEFQGTADFDPGAGAFRLTATPAGATAGPPIDTYVSKLDADGNFAWAKQMVGPRWDTGYGIAVDERGLYVTGWFVGTADFNPGSGVFDLTAPGSGPNMFVVKFVDDTVPTVRGVTSPDPDAVYGLGSTLSITVVFRSPVTVTGTPRLLLNNGGRAVYAGGSGTDRLTFAYTVGAGQGVADLDYASTSALELNGGTIRAADGTDAVLTLSTVGEVGSLGAGKNLGVDTPTVSVSVAPATVGEGGGGGLVYTFTRLGLNVTPLTANFTVNGAAAFGTDYTQSGAGTFTATAGTVTFAAGSATATVTLTPVNDRITEPDESVVLAVQPGGAYTASPGTAAGTILDDDVPPDTSLAGGPSGVTTSRAARFTFAGTTTPAGDRVTFQVSLDGAPFAAAASPVSYANLADGPHTFAVRAVDQYGNTDPTPATRTWVVDTVKPTVSVSPPSAAAAKTGDTVTYTVTYADANLAAVTLTAADVTLVRTGTARGTVQVTGTGSTRTVTVTNITGDGTLAVAIRAGTAADQVRLLAPAARGAAFVVDNTAPVVAVAPAGGSARVGGAAAFTVTYADATLAPATLTAAQVALVSPAGVTGTVAVAKTAANRFTVTVSNLSAPGTLAVSVAAGAAEDAFGRLSPGPVTSRSVAVR